MYVLNIAHFKIRGFLLTKNSGCNVDLSQLDLSCQQKCQTHQFSRKMNVKKYTNTTKVET